jgi:hypothetical protein
VFQLISLIKLGVIWKFDLPSFRRLKTIKILSLPSKPLDFNFILGFSRLFVNMVFWPKKTFSYMSYAFVYDNPLFRRCDYKISAIAPQLSGLEEAKA